ncbi:MAG: 4-hydroxy-tetrahydrodipicolinate synthase [FCB group bacterium]|jgi:4-hydroxy-tetrahydrodipicolinate synthase|nr:4-hydroxy-tetrahydrodipicolinate synthase [FCB group bacterium]
MFRGSIVALVTPFKSNSDVDFDAYGRLIDWQIEQGIDGIVPCGCTGEAATLSHDEQEQVIRFATERIAGRVKVIAGTGSNSTREALRLTQYAKEVGADGALLITPYYNKPTPAGQIAHYKTIAEAVDIPIVLYNVPSRTGTNVLPETVAELNKVPNIVAVKEAAGSVDQVSQIRGCCDITVLSGDDSLTLPMMSVGATGVISVAANVVPAQSAQLCREFDNGNLAAAQKLHFELLPLFKALFIETNPMPVKAALAYMGLIENNLRLPLTPMQEAKFPPLEKALKDLGIAKGALSAALSK